MSDEPYIEAHFVDQEQTTIEITMFYVPRGMRRQGVGTRLYNEWERALPATVQKVRLFAADTDGAGNSDAFWESLGFEWKFSSEDPSDLDDIMCHTMHKGVNGHPTPTPVFVEPYEDSSDPPTLRG